MPISRRRLAVALILLLALAACQHRGGSAGPSSGSDGTTNDTTRSDGY
jgi:hypothetical protein